MATVFASSILNCEDGEHNFKGEQGAYGVPYAPTYGVPYAVRCKLKEFSGAGGCTVRENSQPAAVMDSWCHAQGSITSQFCYLKPSAQHNTQRYSTLP